MFPAWQWEDLRVFDLKSATALLSEGGLITLKEFSIWRDDRGVLNLKMVAEGHQSDFLRSELPGTVRASDNRLSVSGLTFNGRQAKIECKHVVLFGQNYNFRASGTDETTISGRCNSADRSYEEDQDVRYTIEWIGRIKERGIWFGSQQDIERSRSARIQIGGPGGFVIDDEILSESHRSDALGIDLPTSKFFIIPEVDRESAEGLPVDGGCLIYIGDVDPILRKRNRQALSFCLGQYIECIGSTKLNSKHEAVCRESFSCSELGHINRNVSNISPAPLHDTIENAVDERGLSAAVAAISSAYDRLRFSELSWAYWYAACAPVHMAAAHYGAVLEFLLRTVATESGLSTIILPDSDWKIIRDRLLGILPESEDRFTILRKKVYTLNQKPINAQFKTVLGQLCLNHGNLEERAWKRRNHAAHGIISNSVDPISLMRDIKMLKILVHRIILAASGASDRYIDTYTIGHPIRMLSEPVT